MAAASSAQLWLAALLCLVSLAICSAGDCPTVPGAGKITAQYLQPEQPQKNWNISVTLVGTSTISLSDPDVVAVVSSAETYIQSNTAKFCWGAYPPCPVGANTDFKYLYVFNVPSWSQTGPNVSYNIMLTIQEQAKLIACTKIYFTLQ